VSWVSPAISCFVYAYFNEHVNLKAFATDVVRVNVDARVRTSVRCPQVLCWSVLARLDDVVEPWLPCDADGNSDSAMGLLHVNSLRLPVP